MTGRAATALGALATILAVTAAWWALALWPSGAGVPDWVERTRAVCFGVSPGGLPNAGGWTLLIGEPVGMLGFLFVVWGSDVREGLAALRRSGPGRAALALPVAALVLGLAAATVRVASAREAGEPFELRAGASAPERLNREPPPLGLVDQEGDTVRLEQFEGRPVVVAFAYAHCETVCPLIVRDAARAVERSPDAVLLVVTLDPWRDTPERLRSMTEAWRLPAGARALGGSVEAVERALDAWGVGRARDPRTGAITHGTAVHLIDRKGRLAYLTSGTADRLAALILRL